MEEEEAVAVAVVIGMVVMNGEAEGMMEVVVEMEEVVVETEL